MKTRLKDLYDCFYTPPEFSEQKQEVEECHQTLIKVLEKPERRLVLRIMDAQSLMAEERSIDSFISGFELAWQLSMELNQYENERSVSRCTASRSHRLLKRPQRVKYQSHLNRMPHHSKNRSLPRHPTAHRTTWSMCRALDG